MFQITDNTKVDVVDGRWWAWNRKRVINGPIIIYGLNTKFYGLPSLIDSKWHECQGFFRMSNDSLLIGGSDIAYDAVIFEFKNFKYDGATFINDWFPLITKAAAVHDALLRDECSKRIGTHYDMYAHYIMYIIIASKHPKSAYAIIIGLVLFYPIYISFLNIKDKVKRLFKRG